MPIYANDAQLYSCFQTLFGIIEEKVPKAADTLLKSAMTIKFNCSAPTAFITINARKAPVQLLYGSTEAKPTIEVVLTADTLHCLLLGELRLTKALGSELMVCKGPVWKTLSLADIFRNAQRFYPDVLRDNGLPDTCPGTLRPAG